MSLPGSARRLNAEWENGLAAADKKARASLRAAGGSSPGVIHVTASVYNREAFIGVGGGFGFYELIMPGAFEDALAGRQERDVVALVNHDPSFLLGRTASGTLRLSDSPEGLLFDVHVPDTTAGRDAHALARRGDLRGASFAFSVPSGGERELERPDGEVLRVVDRATLFDVSPVTSPAYIETSLGARAAHPEVGRLERLAVVRREATAHRVQALAAAPAGKLTDLLGRMRGGVPATRTFPADWRA